MDKTTLEAAAAEAAKLAETYGLAKGVKPENVHRRVTSLVANGTDALLARSLAIEAENTQVTKDGQRAADREKAEEAARKSVGDQVLKMTIAQLRTFAAEKGIVIVETVTSRAEILGVVQAALANQ